MSNRSLTNHSSPLSDRLLDAIPRPVLDSAVMELVQLVLQDLLHLFIDIYHLDHDQKICQDKRA